MASSYQYNHLIDFTPQELFSLIAIDKTLKQLSGEDVAVPILGWVILGYDVVQIIQKTISSYNLLVKPEDKLSLR